ncbi:MAG: DUF1553 domain-containing protein [Acidobacteria bacterium]|nr:DUF1553 domain-containing protein [Acidobacteriota bacterium]
MKLGRPLDTRKPGWSHKGALMMHLYGFLRRSLAGSAVVCLAFCSGLGWIEPAAGQSDSRFAQEVQPILEQNCLPCHGPETHMSGLAVTSVEALLAGGARQGAAITPGHPEQSPLIRALEGSLTPQMPMGKPPLSSGQIETLAAWIREFQPPARSSEAGGWNPFEAPQRPAAPAVENEAWTRNPIDRFVLAALEAKGLQPSPEADKRTLLRRVYFDVAGEPPTPEETAAFLADDSPEAYEKVVDRLLADARYGERWGRHWLDLARYADSMGFEADREQYHMWRYRDYVVRSLNADKPYDQFVKEQLAGDEIAPKDPDALIATGFLRLGPVFQTTIAAQLRQMLLDEITGTVSSVFLGLTVGCAQCHDHKYDPFPQKDYYRLQAFFAPMELVQTDLPFADETLRRRMDEERQEAEGRLAARQEKLDAYQDVLLAKWRAACEGQSCEGEEIAAKNLKNKLLTAIANGLVPNDDPTFSLEEKKRFLDLLDYVDDSMGGRDKGVFRRQIERHKPRAHVVRNLTVSGFNAAPPVHFVKLGGEYNRLGERVEPGFLTAITGAEEPARLPTDTFGNVRNWRVALADWIASKDNPLTARVMVNRIWQKRFGAGIVATPSDFGRNGARPTHPELLDWLAVELMEQGWSLKAIHRLMLTSATYRQDSRIDSEEAREADPGNRLLWRMNRRRLEGEIIRDAVLAVSGRLNEEMEGPGMFPRLPEPLKDSVRIKNFTAWEPTDGPQSRRRSLYIFQRRQIEFPFLAVMDAPVLQAPRETRPVSTTALQALTLLNGELVNDEAREFAARVVRESGEDLGRQARRAFELALSRPPTADELAQAKDFLATEEQDALLGLCRILFNTNEFVYVD